MDSSVGHPKLVLLDQQRQGSVQNRGIIGIIDVELDHLSEQGWLRSVQVVDSSAIGHEAELFNKVQEVLNGVLGNLNEGSTSAQQAVEDPVRVPVVWLTEATTRDDKGAVDGNEAVGAVGAVVGLSVVGASKVGPNVDNLGDEFVDDGVVDRIQELGIRLELIIGNLLELTTSIVKVGVEEVIQSCVVAEGLL